MQMPLKKIKAVPNKPVIENGTYVLGAFNSRCFIIQKVTPAPIFGLTSTTINSNDELTKQSSIANGYVYMNGGDLGKAASTAIYTPNSIEQSLMGPAAAGAATGMAVISTGVPGGVGGHALQSTAAIMQTALVPAPVIATATDYALVNGGMLTAAAAAAVPPPDVADYYQNDGGGGGSQHTSMITENHGGGIAIGDMKNENDLDSLKKRMTAQLEYYFSPENLAKDEYLRNQMDNESYVLISMVANFKRIKSVSTDIELITQVLRESPNVQVDDEGLRVRPNHKRCTVILRDVPENTTADDIKGLFAAENFPKFPAIEFASANAWYLTFESDEDAQRAHTYIRTEVKELNGRPISACIKKKPMQRMAISNAATMKNGYRPNPPSAAATSATITFDPNAAAAAAQIAGPRYFISGPTGAMPGFSNLVLPYPQPIYQGFVTAPWPQQGTTTTTAAPPPQHTQNHGFYDLASVFHANGLAPQVYSKQQNNRYNTGGHRTGARNKRQTGNTGNEHRGPGTSSNPDLTHQQPQMHHSSNTRNQTNSSSYYHQQSQQQQQPPPPQPHVGGHGSQQQQQAPQTQQQQHQVVSSGGGKSSNPYTSNKSGNESHYSSSSSSMKYHMKEDRTVVPHYTFQSGGGYPYSQHHGGNQHGGTYYGHPQSYDEKSQQQQQEHDEPMYNRSKDSWNNRPKGGRRRRDENDNRSLPNNSATGAGNNAGAHYHQNNKQNVSASPNVHRNERPDRDFRGGDRGDHEQTKGGSGLQQAHSNTSVGSGGSAAQNAFNSNNNVNAASQPAPQQRQQFDLKQAAFPPLPTNNSQPPTKSSAAPMKASLTAAAAAAAGTATGSGPGVGSSNATEIPEVSVQSVGGGGGAGSGGSAGSVAATLSTTAAWGGDRLADVVKGTAGRLSVTKKTDKEARSASQSPDPASTTSFPASITTSQSNELTTKSEPKDVGVVVAAAAAVPAPTPNMPHLPSALSGSTNSASPKESLATADAAPDASATTTTTTTTAIPSTTTGNANPSSNKLINNNSVIKCTTANTTTMTAQTSTADKATKTDELLLQNGEPTVASAAMSAAVKVPPTTTNAATMTISSDAIVATASVNTHATTITSVATPVATTAAAAAAKSMTSASTMTVPVSKTTNPVSGPKSPLPKQSSTSASLSKQLTPNANDVNAFPFPPTSAAAATTPSVVEVASPPAPVGKLSYAQAAQLAKERNIEEAERAEKAEEASGMSGGQMVGNKGGKKDVKETYGNEQRERKDSFRANVGRKERRDSNNKSKGNEGADTQSQQQPHNYHHHHHQNNYLKENNNNMNNKGGRQNRTHQYNNKDGNTTSYQASRPRSPK